MVDQLKGKNGFNTGDLTADNLRTALNDDTVKTTIKALLENEFGLTVDQANRDISVTAPGGDKVTVSITGKGGAGTHNGFSTVIQANGIPQDIELEVVLKNVEGSTLEKAERFGV